MLPSPASHRALSRFQRGAGGLLLVLAGCSPTFDWREAQADDAPVTALFPCKPDRFSRTVTLAGAPATMRMQSCSAGDMTFALSHVDVADPSRVGLTLAALRTATASNIAAAPRVLGPAAVPGMQPQALAEGLQFEGRRPDGGPLRLRALYFAGATKVYQATAVGSKLDTEAADTFFAGLRLPP